jgi:putative redox protein
MTTHQIYTNWTEGMAFESFQENHVVTFDANPENGGKGLGMSPKMMLLNALSGCTGMDVVALLNKMRIPFNSLRIEVSGELTDTHPKVYSSIHIRYLVDTHPENRPQVEKAVIFSLTKYCGVTAMLSKTAQITHEILIQTPVLS